METSTTLAKKTKAELISAYEELVAKQHELEGASARTYGEADTASFKKASAAFSGEQVQTTLASLRSAAGDAIGAFAKAFEGQVRRFEELNRAVALAEERLKLVHELETGADVAAQLIAGFEEERAKLEREIAARKRDWEREQEEEKYRADVARKRAADTAAEEARKREAVLKEREAAVKERESAVDAQEKAMAALATRVEQLPAEIARESDKRISEAKKQWESELKRALADKDAEREHLAKLNDLEKKNLTQELARLQAECAALRKDAELANRKAQELAVRIVERGTGERHVASAAPAPSDGSRKE